MAEKQVVGPVRNSALSLLNKGHGIIDAINKQGYVEVETQLNFVNLPKWFKKIIGPIKIKSKVKIPK